jgi:hypothetical protein
VKLSHLIAKTHKVSLEYSGEPVNLVVRSEALTAELMATLAALGQSQLDAQGTPDDASDVVKAAAGVKSMQAMAMMPELLCQVVESWDVLGDDEKPFPLIPSEVARVIPVAFSAACIQAATTTVGEAPAPRSGKASGATSSRTVK